MAEKGEKVILPDEAVLSYLLLDDGAKSELQTKIKRGRGRPAFHLKYPRFVETVDKFIVSHGVAAHNRRRDSVQYSAGVQLHQIRSHLLKEIPEMSDEKLCLDTIHKIMSAPRKNSGAAPRYKCKVNSKLAYKKNDLIKDAHADTHYASAQVLLFFCIYRLCNNSVFKIFLLSICN